MQGPQSSADRNVTPASAEAGTPERTQSVVLGEIALALSRATDAADAVQKTVESLQGYFRTWSLGIWLEDRSDGLLHLEGLALPPDYPEDVADAVVESYRSVPLDSDLPGAEAMRRGRTVRLGREDPDLSEEMSALMDMLGASGLVALPILMQDQPLGCAVVTEMDGDSFTSDQEELLVSALRLIAIVFHRVRLVERERERSLRLRTLSEAVEHLPIAVKIMSPDWVIQWANPAIETLLGYTPDEVVGLRIDELRQADGPDAVQRQIEGAVLQGSWSGEVMDRHRTGRAVPVRSTVVPVRNESGELAALVDVERDLTDERAQQVRMEDAYRLAAVGELAAGVAHEVNNPLQAIAATAEVLLLESLPESTRSDLEAIRVEAKRGGMIVRNLLAFARPKPPVKTMVDLNEVVDSVVNLRGPQIRLRNIDVRIEADPSAPRVHADINQLKQVLHNIIGNAGQAIQKEFDDGTIRVRVRCTNGDVALAVEDTGPGIPKDVMPNIFRPFYTTKDVGEGTGLGLSVSLKLVRENGGELEAANWGRPVSEGGRPGDGGARFVMRFPRPAEEECDVTPAGPESSAQRVLVVDDEPIIASAARRFLQHAGYEAEIAHTAEEALELIDQSQGFAAILVDINMPGMGGQGFYEVARERHPSLLDRVIFTSGDVVSPETHRFLASTRRPALEKPYQLSELVESVEKVIDESG